MPSVQQAAQQSAANGVDDGEASHSQFHMIGRHVRMACPLSLQCKRAAPIAHMAALMCACFCNMLPDMKVCYAADLNEWEDVDVNRAPTEVKAESSNQQLADDDEWEDV